MTAAGATPVGAAGRQGAYTPRWEYVRLVRQPSGFGVAKMTVRHPVAGSVVVALDRTELRLLAMAAIEAMEPEDPAARGDQ